MSALDPMYVRSYQNEIRRWECEAARLSGYVATRAEGIRDGVSTAIALDDAQNLARDVAELITALARLTALKEVAFLTTDPDAPEVPR